MSDCSIGRAGLPFDISASTVLNYETQVVVVTVTTVAAVSLHK